MATRVRDIIQKLVIFTASLAAAFDFDESEACAPTPAKNVYSCEDSADVLTLLQSFGDKTSFTYAQKSAGECAEGVGKCAEDIRWAMEEGIRKHPDWYPGLSSASSFDDFQAHLARTHPPSRCPVPCVQSTAKADAADAAHAEQSQLVDEAEERFSDGCGEPSPDCRNDVDWAMKVGIKQHPDWYPGLDEFGSFEDFQAFLAASSGAGHCRLPCTGPPTPAPPASPAEKFVRLAEGKCKPRLLRTKCEGESYRGLVVFFHGFSACADQIDELAPRLNEACLDVFAPVHPGHGIGVSTCATERCDVTFGDGSRGFNLRAVPTSSAQYTRHVQIVADVAKAELKYRNEQLGTESGSLRTFGLSLGAAMAQRLATLLPGKVSRVLLVSPSFGTADEIVDVPLSQCLQAATIGVTTMAECATQLKDAIHKQPWFVASLLNVVIPGRSPGEVQAFMMKLYTRLELLSPLMQMPHAWDEVCSKILNNGRMGFCAFRMKHILAMHAFGISTLGLDPGDQIPRTQFISTARDGMTRNGLAYSLATSLSSRVPGNVAMCMHPFQAGTNVNDLGQYFSNEHSMPHASIGRADNPGYRWWEPKLSEDVTRFLSDQVDSLGVAGYVADMRRCVDLPLGAAKPSELSWLRPLVLPEADPEPLLVKIDGSELWWTCGQRHMQSCLWFRFWCCNRGYSYKDGKCQDLVEFEAYADAQNKSLTVTLIKKEPVPHLPYLDNER
eukprot:TRINITY_DN2230_c0_g2_i2.p1 TRINITY_DN2230_c0_g2~~TRINITY_DN2230_c0_g2_i2.p1  ORF type:complete len:726 (-),score=100.48 TRINITY_DN2230_c0_g2_i2:291-2468(-)